MKIVQRRYSNLSDEEIIKLESTRLFMQREIGLAIKYGTFQGGVTIADVAEELKSFYSEDEISYLKTML